MKIFTKFILLFLYYLIGDNLLLSQFSFPIFERISITEGLSQSSVTSIVQDKNGFLWLGTLDGLNKYDGFSFTIFKFNPHDTNTISGNYINSLFEDSKENLWIGSIGSGLTKYEPKSGIFTRYNSNSANSIPNNDIYSFVEDKSNHIWMTTNNGLCEYNPITNNFTNYKFNPSNNNSLNNLRSSFLDENNNLWLGSLTCLIKFNIQNKSYQIIELKNKGSTGLTSIKRIWSIIEGNSDILWLGSQNGLVKFSKSSGLLKFYSFSNNDKSDQKVNHINSLCKDKTNKIWIGTYGKGIQRFDPISEKFELIKNNLVDNMSLSSDLILKIYQDRAGFLWIGTEIGGLNKYDPRRESFHHFKKDPLNKFSLNCNVIFSLLEDNDEILWVGTWGGGLNRYDKKTNKFSNYITDKINSVSYNTIWALEEDKQGNLIIGTWGNGIDILDKSRTKFSHIRKDKNNTNNSEDLGLNSNSIHALHCDNHGQLWIGTSDGGLNLYNFKTKKFKHFMKNLDDPNSISDNYISTIFEDKENIMWIGTSNGLNRFDKNTEKFKSFKNNRNDPNSISNDNILSITEDKNGFLWIGTRGGLNKFEKKTQKFTYYSQKDGLPNDVIYGILEDKFGNLWLSTNNGICKFNPVTLHTKIFTFSDGLQSNEFNQNAFLKNYQGTFFFGGINGFNMFDPEEISENSNFSPVLITDIRTNDRKINEYKNNDSIKIIELPYNQNSLSFEFISLNYWNPSKIQYAYFLEGHDDNWIFCGKQRSARYSNVPPGEYVFKVSSTNNDNLWNDKYTTLIIKISPPFWNSWWFRILIIIILSVISIKFYLYRIRIKSKRDQKLEKLISERTAELNTKIEDLSKIIQTANFINSGSDFKSLVNVLLENSDLIKVCDRSAILIYDHFSNSFKFLPLFGFPQDSLDSPSLAIQETHHKFTLQSKEIFEDLFIINDGSNKITDEKFKFLENSKSLLILRITIDNFPAGYLLFDNKTRENAFTLKEIRFLFDLKPNIKSTFIKAKMLDELKSLNENKNLFMGMVAHDLINALSVIGGFIKVLYDSIKMNDFNIEDSIFELEEILNASERMKEILTDLLNFAAIEQGKLSISISDNDLNWIISSSIEFYKKTSLKKNIEINFDLDESLPIMRIDKIRLTQVIDNLLSNAIKFTYFGGKISVRSYRVDNAATVVVHDNGQGLDKKDLEQVFKSFKKLSARPTANEQSTGLGLSIVKQIIEMHNGKVFVESKKGIGSSFGFTIPINPIN